MPFRDENAAQGGQYFYDDAVMLPNEPSKSANASYFFDAGCLNTFENPQFVAAEAARKAQERFGYHYDTATLLEPDFSFLHKSEPAADSQSATVSSPVKLPAYDIARAARKPGETPFSDEPLKKMAAPIDDLRETSARSVIAS